jgi:signal transduction histidine kinase
MSDRIRELEQALAHEQSARREAERQAQLLHALFMEAPSLLMVLRGPEHVVELANPLACQMFRRTAAEVVGRPLFDVLPELRDQVFPVLLDGVFRTGTPFAGKETPAVFDRGGGKTETVYFNFLYTAFRNAEDQVAGVFVIATDVTAQVLAREQLNSLREAAESANRAKDEFLAMLGHELRNPLSPILTALQLMKLHGPQGSERAREVIERQVMHLTRLVDDLLDVSRIARGKVELKREVIELAEIVAKAIEMASPLLEQRNHALTVDVPRHGLAVDADPTRLGQVVSNLLTNAAKYTPPAGRITVRARAEGGELMLSVQDTGIGIGPEVLPRIFEMFVQDIQASDRALGGLGLGLTIVRNLVERHGGSVSVRSDGPGRGSEFLVRLPRVERAAQAAEVRLPAARGGKLSVELPRILVVDDNADGAEMLAEILIEKGYDTRVAHDAPTALRVAAEFSPNVAFLDIGLPVMDGYELASHLRELPGLRGLRLIAVTGYGQESDRQRTREAGFHDHLVKPVDIDSLVSVVTARV